MAFVSEIFIEESLGYEYEGEESGVQGTKKLKGKSLQIDPADKGQRDPDDSTKDDTWQTGKDRLPGGSLFGTADTGKECGCGADKYGDEAGTRGPKLSKEAIYNLFT